jgi:hypothetical protein
VREFDGEIDAMLPGRCRSRIGVMDSERAMLLGREPLCQTPLDEPARRLMLTLGRSAVLDGGDPRFGKFDDPNVQGKFSCAPTGGPT